MGYTHFDKVSGINGIGVGAKGSEVEVANATGQLRQSGTAITASAAELNKLDNSTFTAAQLEGFIKSLATVTALDGSAGQKAIPINGIAQIAGGTGISDMTLAAPAPGSLVVIRLASITSGTVVVTTATGVTFDGSNNTATFGQADDTLVLVYKSATEWSIVLNAGAVALSTV